MKYTLYGGFTSSRVERDGDKVIKTGGSVPDEAIWYDAYLDKEDLPEIFTFNGLSVEMQFLETVGPVDLDKVIEKVERYKSYQWLNKYNFRTYYERILYHVEKSEVSNGHRLLDKLKPVYLEPTFAHGDLSIKNIIQTATGPKFIDPLYYRNFGSYILDYAKLAFTLKFFSEDVIGFERIKAQANFEYFDVLVASECMRVATYNHKFDFIAENLINEL